MARDDVRLVLAIIDHAADRPDYNYRSDHSFCRYVEEAEDGTLKGSCIVGCGLVSIGVKPQDIIDLGNSYSADMLLGNVPELELSVQVVNLIQGVQVCQDTSVPWGRAVEPLKKWIAEQKEKFYQ